MAKKIWLCSGLLLALVTTKTLAQTEDTAPRFNSRIGVSYTTEGAGLDDFVSVEGFIPLLHPGNSLTYLEGRLLLETPKNTLGGNLTVGHRFLDASENWLFGGYLSYDNRNTGNAVFNQLGAGIEALSEDWEGRVNAYFPIGNTRSLLTETFPGSTFEHHILKLDRIRQFEEALTGFDAEIGTQLLRWGNGSVRGYVGLYYYTGDDIEGFLGIKGRLVARPIDNVEVGLTLQNDPRFDTNLVFGVRLNLPLIRPRKTLGILARMSEPIQRQASILVDNQSVADTVTALNPSTGEPFKFQHVQLGASTTDGTFEQPLGTVAEAIAAAQPNEIIYVQSGTNPGIAGFTLPDSVSLLSTAPVQQLDTIQTPGVVLPFSGTGILPKVTGTVNLAGNQTLSGLAISTASERGIFAQDTSNLTIRDHTITTSNLRFDKIATSKSEGIWLENITGKVNILNNTVIYNGANTVYGHIQFRNNQGQVDLTIAGNTVIGNPISNSDGIEVDICRDYWRTDPFFSPCSSPTQATVRILNNNITNIGNPNAVPRQTGDGIDINLGNYSQANFTINNNTIQRVGDRGIGYGTSRTAQSTATMSHNLISDYYRDAIGFYARDTAISTFTISENTFFNHNFGSSTGFTSKTQDSGQLWVSIYSNTINNVGSDAIVFITKDNSQTFANVQFNTIPNDGLTASARKQSRICLNLSHNQTQLGFNLIQKNQATFQLDSSLLSTNTGTVTQTGIISNVPEGSCNFP